MVFCPSRVGFADAIQNLTTTEPEEGGVPAGKTLVKVLANSKETSSA
jgi:hypothetical protein